MRRYRPSYFLANAFKGLWRNGMMTFASVTVLLSCLIVMGCFTMLLFNIEYNLDSIGDMNEIVAFVDSDVTYQGGDEVRLASSVTGKDVSFLGWSTDPEATAADFTAGSVYAVNPDHAIGGVITMYAVWQGRVPEATFRVVYHASGMTLDTELPVDETLHEAGEVLVLPEAPIAKNSMITFLGWSFTPGATEATLKPGDEITLNADEVRGQTLTLYAIWSEMPVFSQYAVVYDSNGVAVEKMPTDASVRLNYVRTEIGKLKNIAKDGVTFISKEQTLEEEKENLKDYPGLLSILEGGANPYPDTFVITYDDNSQVAALQLQLEHIDGIYKVRCRADIAEGIENLKNGVILVFSWFMVILFAVSIFVIFNTVKLALDARSKEITIMRYVGATKWFIALPFQLEGIIIGLFSGAAAYFVQWYAYGYVQKMIMGDMQMIRIMPFGDLQVLLFVGCLAVGVFTGFVGSILSIRKYLKA